MQALHRFAFATRRVAASLSHDSLLPPTSSRIISFSTDSRDGGGGAFDAEWHTTTSWSTGIAGEHFNGEPSPSKSAVLSELQDTEDKVRELEAANRRGKAYVDSWGRRLTETSVLMKQIQEPGARGSYLKDSEKAEMYRLHKKNPEVYTVEKLAKDYRIMRQRVHAILWLKEIEEEEEKKLGHPLDDSIELLLDTFPESVFQFLRV